MNISSKPGVIDVEIHGNFIDGREVEAGSGEMLDVRNPATDDVIARIPEFNCRRYRPRHEKCAHGL